MAETDARSPVTPKAPGRDRVTYHYQTTDREIGHMSPEASDILRDQRLE